MKKLSYVAIILSIIAIILSIISITIRSTQNNQNFVTRSELYQEHALVATALQTSDFSIFKDKLNDYNQCIRAAVSTYANCDQTTSGVTAFQCYNNLNLNMAECQDKFNS